MAKASLTSQSCHFCLVIRKNISIDLSIINNWLEANCNEYAYITHAKDISPNTGEVEGIHYHFVFNTKKRHQVAWVLNQVRDIYNFDSVNGIQVDIYKSFEASIQYLTHQNEPLKTQHNASEIITNLDKETFSLVMNSEVTFLTYETLEGIILKARRKCDVIRDLGITQYNRLRNTISDMWHELKD